MAAGIFFSAPATIRPFAGVCGKAPIVCLDCRVFRYGEAKKNWRGPYGGGGKEGGTVRALARNGSAKWVCVMSFTQDNALYLSEVDGSLTR